MSIPLFKRTPNLVIPNIPDGITLLTPDEDRQIREQLSENYAEILARYLNKVSKGDFSGCTQDATIITGTEIYDWKVSPPKLLLSTTQKFGYTTHEDLDITCCEYFFEIIQQIEKCKADIFYIPLRILNYPAPKPVPRDFAIKAHQNLLIYYRTDKKLIWIEPDEAPKSVHDRLRDHIYTYLAEPLKVTQENFIQPEILCLQRLANDRNCMFWTFLVVVLLVVNKSSDVDDTLARFQKEVPADNIKQYIEKFKAFMTRKTDSVVETGGGRKWVISTAKRSRSKFKLHRYTKKSRMLKRGKRALRN